MVGGAPTSIIIENEDGTETHIVTTMDSTELQSAPGRARASLGGIPEGTAIMLQENQGQLWMEGERQGEKGRERDRERERKGGRERGRREREGVRIMVIAIID